MHWGLYCVPAYGEWYWNDMFQNGSDTQRFHDAVYGREFKYQDFVPMWKAEVFNPDEWAALFKKSGARWVTMTSKHHEGYALWQSNKAWNWNTVDNIPHRDLLKDLSTAVRAAGIHWGIYYSLFEWFHPDYTGPNPEIYVNGTMLPQMYDIATNYQPDIFYVDGEWDYDSDFWQTRPFLAWLFNSSPNKENVVINDRWGNETRGKHGGYYVCENEGASPYCPAQQNSTHPWANHMTIGSTFGYNRMDVPGETRNSTFFIHLLVISVATGGGLEINVGPTSDGRIAFEQQEVLLAMGAWLEVNGEAIYGSKTFRIRHDNVTDAIYYTSNNGYVYALSLGWPVNNQLVLTGVNTNGDTQIEFLGYRGAPLKWTSNAGTTTVQVPQLSVDQIPCKDAFVFRMKNVS